jgi:hypothetical protein
MDYRAQLLRPLSKRYIDQLVESIIVCPLDFPILFQLLFDEDEKVSWRAAWACSKISERNPDFFTSQQVAEIVILSLSTSYGGVRRGCLSMLFHLPLPNPIPVELINSCFEWMLSPKSPIAVQAYAMKMLYRICLQEPDFKAELIANLETLDYQSYSAGFNSTRKNILKSLNNC